jgi:hypothetical protein
MEVPRAAMVRQVEEVNERSLEEPGMNKDSAAGGSQVDSIPPQGGVEVEIDHIQEVPQVQVLQHIRSPQDEMTSTQSNG